MSSTTRPTATVTLAPRAGAPCRAAVRAPVHAGRTSGSRRSPAPRAVRAPRRRRIRLTGRGRGVLILVVATLLAVAFSIGRASSTATSHVGQAQFRQVVVQPGDTLWSIARRSVPDADPRVTVQRLIDLNGLGSTAVVPGQQLRLPTAR